MQALVFLCLMCITLLSLPPCISNYWLLRCPYFSFRRYLLPLGHESPLTVNLTRLVCQRRILASHFHSLNYHKQLFTATDLMTTSTTTTAVT